MSGPLLEKFVGLRMSHDEYQSYLKAAADLGLSLSEYLRLRLVNAGEDLVADQIAQLRLALVDTSDDDVSRGALRLLMLELLLSLRHLMKPAELRTVHAELQRLGTTPWAPAQHRPGTPEP